MVSAAGATSGQATARPQLPKVLWTAGGIALLVLLLFYGMRFIGAASFHQERAFRVLDEFGGQLENLQSAMAILLKQMPTDLQTDACLTTDGEITPSCHEDFLTYKSRLTLPGTSLEVLRVDNSSSGSMCSQDLDRQVFLLEPTEHGVPFRAFTCGKSREKGLRIGLQGKLRETTASLVNQDFFDEVLIALPNGAVISSVPMRHPALAAGKVELHAVKTQRPSIVDVGPMLRRAIAVQDGEDSDTPPPSGAMPLQPLTFTETIGGERFRVFVHVLRPSYPLFIEQPMGRPAQAQEQIYLVALKRDNVRADIAGSLGPDGRFLLTVLVLLVFLAWPLTAVRSKSTDDGIGWPEVAACALSLLFIPATLAISAVWVWSYFSLLSWADAGAEVYADRLVETVESELQVDRQLLGTYRTLFQEVLQRSHTGKPELNCSNIDEKQLSVPIRVDDRERVSAVQPTMKTTLSNKQECKDIAFVLRAAAPANEAHPQGQSSNRGRRWCR